MLTKLIISTICGFNKLEKVTPCFYLGTVGRKCE